MRNSFIISVDLVSRHTVWNSLNLGNKFHHADITTICAFRQSRPHDRTSPRSLVDTFDDSSCRLVVLGCVAPASVDTEHTISTLRTVMELSPQTSAAGPTQDAAGGGAQCTTTTQHVRRLRLNAHAASH
eukprot:4250939-Pleurochrysis_carterae.AAC.1